MKVPRLILMSPDPRNRPPPRPLTAMPSSTMRSPLDTSWPRSLPDWRKSPPPSKNAAHLLSFTCPAEPMPIPNFEKMPPALSFRASSVLWTMAKNPTGRKFRTLLLRSCCLEQTYINYWRQGGFCPPQCPSSTEGLRDSQSSSPRGLAR